jgi:hypothetical protein
MKRGAGENGWGAGGVLGRRRGGCRSQELVHVSSLSLERPINATVRVHVNSSVQYTRERWQLRCMR